ncbi:pyridoxal phosphate-dependent aminotransferase [Streptomyces sp. DSM 44915]|uniref:Pyridoxal phosphate-dependent aminotransferase n=1 Tax=Streptomyces chisholmiae TaxID=3075540 RepID=A0ABU2JXH2_9ACTN|nr:pyridoxal phosphate-dependent aminotransferase [Streptomyces sp. DSM 44915]MDT0269458.1 pyridoxal phosphate-dependent aminotransferase [Streptomyces sp. DSM 44915]
MTASGRRHPRRPRAFGTTVFAEMSELAARTGAINLGQGFPDQDGPDSVREAAVAALRAGRGNQYPPVAGVPELRAAVADHQRARYGLAFDPEREVLVTAGATEAIAATLLALVSPGDEVVVLDPAYDAYAAAIALAGGVRVSVPLRPERGAFRLDPAELRAAVTPRTRLLLVNSPHNPTGTVLTRAELTGIAELAVEHDLLVVTDEVYEHLVYGVEHLPLAGWPGMRERTVTVGSAGKTFSFTGWKIGWLTAPADLLGAVLAVKQYLTYVPAGPLQYAVAKALRLPPAYFDGLRAELADRRELLVAGLERAGFGVFRPAGTYFVTADIRPLGERDGVAFCRALPDRAGVVAVPSAVFYQRPELGAPFVRFAFCKRPAVLRAAADRLASLGPAGGRPAAADSPLSTV